MSLYDILPTKLKKDLSEAEKEFLGTAEEGEIADFQAASVRAELLYWLCTNEKATTLVHPEGVMVLNAEVIGELDFTSATIPRPLRLRRCLLGNVLLTDATTNLLDFSESFVGSISADGLVTKGDVLLQVKKAKTVDLRKANIGGHLLCERAEFEAEDRAFVADYLITKGAVSLNNVKANGEVRFVGADIDGDLYCKDAEFISSSGNAFSADRLSVRGGVYFQVNKAVGEVRFVGADIGGDLFCEGAEFENPNGDAFSADNVSIKGNVLLSSVTANGRVSLVGASIGSDLRKGNSLVLSSPDISA